MQSADSSWLCTISTHRIQLPCIYSLYLSFSPHGPAPHITTSCKVSELSRCFLPPPADVSVPCAQLNCHLDNFLVAESTPASMAASPVSAWLCSSLIPNFEGSANKTLGFYPSWSPKLSTFGSQIFLSSIDSRSLWEFRVTVNTPGRLEENVDFTFITRAGRAPSAWLIPVVLKKPSPELPFKKIGQNTHVIHSISLRFPLGCWKPSPELICFWMGVVLHSWSRIFKGHRPVQSQPFLLALMRGDSSGCTVTTPESLLSDGCHKVFCKAQDWEVDVRMWNPCHFLSCPGESACQMSGCASYLKTTKASSDWSFLILQF